MAIEFTCPNCDKLLRAQDDQAWSAPRKLVHVEWESHEGREGQGDSKDGKT